MQAILIQQFTFDWLGLGNNMDSMDSILRNFFVVDKNK